MACKYRGRARYDLPHSGPCTLRYECKHPKTPPVVMARACKSSRCRYYTSGGF